MKTIAIDYDDTYSDMPEVFDKFIEYASSKGHVCVIVTFRFPQDVIDSKHEVFYTSGQKKAEYMRENGLEIDIWIDDYPELIGETHI